MTIVQALGWYFPETLGGTEVYVAGLAQRFVAHGHRVIVVAPKAGLSEPLTYEYEGVPVFRYPVPASPTRAEAQGREPARGASHFEEYLHAIKPDVVHAHTFVTGLGVFEVEAARRHARRVIVTSHSSALGFLCHRGTLMFNGAELCEQVVSPAVCVRCALQDRNVPDVIARVAASLPRPVSRVGQVISGKVGTAIGLADLIAFQLETQTRVYELVDQFVVLTEAAKRRLLAHGAPSSRITVNRLGHALIDTAVRTDRVPGPLRVAYIGRLDPIKGVLDLAHACAQLPKELAIRVDFIGPTQDSESIATKAAIERLVGMDQRFRILSPVPHRAIPATLREYDVVCCPARCLEGGPMIALEARALKLPVIGTRIGGLAEIVRDGIDGALVTPGDRRGLARVLETTAAFPEATVDAWRNHIGPTRTLDDVARDYLESFNEAAAA